MVWIQIVFCEKNHIYYDINSAKRDAQRAFYEFNPYLYGVANGLGGEVPGVEKGIDTSCLKLDLRLLLMGADVGGKCNKETYGELNNKAVMYSEYFNKEILRLFRKNYYKYPETNECFQPSADAAG